MDSILSLWPPANLEEQNIEFLAKTAGFSSSDGGTPFFRAWGGRHLAEPTALPIPFIGATRPQGPGPEGGELDGAMAACTLRRPKLSSPVDLRSLLQCYLPTSVHLCAPWVPAAELTSGALSMLVNEH